MTEDFTGKAGIVTGATKGIGLAIAAALIGRGARVYGWGRDAPMGRQTAGKLGSQFIYQRVDVRDAASIQAALEGFWSDCQSIDFLVNNAGITRDDLLLRMKDEDWDEVLDVNLKGAYRCTKAVLRAMLKQRAGVVLNISSVVGQIGNAGQSNYVAAKAGLIGLTKSLAREVGSRHIRVNALAPGFITTDLTASLPQGRKQRYLEHIPLGRFGRVEEVAEIACFLLSDRASYITGQVIRVDGGLVT